MTRAAHDRLSLGRVLICAIAVETTVGPYLADWNATHIYNPTWPPHAKFHNAQTMSLGVGLGLATFWQLWRRHDTPPTPAEPWTRPACPPRCTG